MNIKNIFILLLTISLAGCGASKLLVLEPLELSGDIDGITIKQDKNTVGVPEKVVAYFNKKLHKKLYEELKYKKGKSVTLRSRFISYNEGSRLARYMLAGIGNAGEASLTVAVDFLDNNGKVIGKIQVEGKISSGIGGGSSYSAIDKVINNILDYVASNITI